MRVRGALLVVLAVAMASIVRGQNDDSEEAGDTPAPLTPDKTESLSVTCITPIYIVVPVDDGTDVTVEVRDTTIAAAAGGAGDYNFDPDEGDPIFTTGKPGHTEVFTYKVEDGNGTIASCDAILSVVASAEDITNAADSSSSDTSGSSDTSASSTGLIVLAVLLAALVLGNVLCAGWFFMCKPQKQQAPPQTRRDPNADAELGMVKRELEAEHNRRIRAEGLIQRAKGGGIRPSEFPSVRDVDRHVEQLADDALAWSEKACAIDGSHAALPATIQGVLENTFAVCREEVERCLDERLQNLSAFLGNEEPVLLSGGESMNLDTQYVLYECLCRNFTSIVPAEPEHMEELASVVQRRCGSSADRALTNNVIFGENAWPSFDALMKHYILVFVEMALQKPRMEFGDTLGNKMTFDPRIHRDWAPYFKAPGGQQCSIVFPAVRPVRGRPTSNAKIGVVRIPGR